MRIPRSFSLKGTRYTVHFGECDGAYAEFSDSEQRITISPRKNRKKTERVDSFWHEALHALEHEYDAKIGHEQLRRIASGLTDFMLENGFRLERA